MGLRSGTENVPATIAFAAAITEAEKHLNSERKRLQDLKRSFRQILSDIPNIRFLGKEKNQLASYLPITIPGLDAERLIYALEDRGVYVSTGAACAASKGIKSPSLQAIGLSESEIAGSLRITMGKQTDLPSIQRAGEIIHEIVKDELTRLAR